MNLPEVHHQRAYDISIRQLYLRREVGRITWRRIP
jgi:hypothetical protein